MSEANGIIERWPAITPEDGKSIPVTDGIRCNVDGTAVLTDNKGNSNPFYLIAGLDYPYAVVEVKATGTDADMGLKALYFA